MAQLSLSWLLVALARLLSCGVLTHTVNLCIHSENNGFRTWGPQCQRLCHCRNNAACDFRGYCADGCMRGWTRRTSNGSCRFRTWESTTPNITLLAGTHNINNTNIRDERSIFSSRTTPIYRFSQDKTCTKDNMGVNTKSASLTADPPILVQEFTVIFSVSPRIDDITKATFQLRNFKKNTVTHDMKFTPSDTLGTFSVKNLRYVIIDSIIIAVSSMTAGGSCSPAVIDAFVLSGKPVCPYGKWGVRCERTCMCPCRSPECHPSSGRCLESGFVCPPQKFGQQCSSTCSSGCFGSLRECHALTGVCKECELRNMTGVSCRSALTPEQMIQRDAMCGDMTDVMDATKGSKNATRSSTFDLVYHTNEIQKHGYRVVILILVFLILFLILCCSYVQMVQHCAKRRMKEQLQTMDEARRRQSSMVTYTEFKREFIEMQDDSVPSPSGGSRSDQVMTLQIAHSRRQSFHSSKIARENAGGSPSSSFSVQHSDPEQRRSTNLQ